MAEPGGAHRLRVSVVLISYNERQFLGESLGSLLQQTRKPDEIIVVDNASSDGSADLVRSRFPDVRLIAQKENLGFAGGCNLGVRTATSELVAIFNNDARLDPRWLEELVTPLEADPTLTAAQSLILLYDEPNLVNTSALTLNYLGVGWCRDYRKPAQTIRGGEIAIMSGAAFAIRREAFLGLGGFDESYFLYHEDVDLSWRLRLSGGRQILVPTSLVYHRYRFTRNPRKVYLLERNRLRTILKNYRLATLVVISPALLLAEAGVCLLALRQRWLGLKLAGYRDLVRDWRTLSANRRTVQRGRRIGDSRVKRWLAGRIEFEEIDTPLVRVGSAVLEAYWTVVRPLIVW